MMIVIRTTYGSPSFYDRIAEMAAQYNGRPDGMEEVTLNDAIGASLVFKSDVYFSNKPDADLFFENRLNGVEYSRM
jgi:hypothetical protein